MLEIIFFNFINYVIFIIQFSGNDILNLEGHPLIKEVMKRNDGNLNQIIYNNIILYIIRWY